MFLMQGNARAVALLKNLYAAGGQSRAILLLGPPGCGKFSAALDFAAEVLGAAPLSHPDFFCFRNDRYALKTEYFLKRMTGAPLAQHFLYLFQRRMAASLLLNETLTLPAGLKLATLKEELENCLLEGRFPENEKSIQNLIDCARAYEKKTGVPMDIVREAIAFHGMHTERGRVSIFGSFDNAEENTQNAALKLLEEPNPKHWIVLTACDHKALIPTILSRVIAIKFSKPRSGDLSCLEGHRNTLHSSLEVMEESVHRISALKADYIKEFFTVLVPQTDKGVTLFAFAEKLEKSGHGEMFLQELLNLLADSLIVRRSALQGTTLPLSYPAYEAFAHVLAKGAPAELEDMARSIEDIKKQVRRPVIKGDSVLPDLFITVSRQIRIFSGR